MGTQENIVKNNKINYFNYLISMNFNQKISLKVFKINKI